MFIKEITIMSFENYFPLWNDLNTAQKKIDTLIPSLVLGQAIGRWGNFVNQEAYGNLITNPDLLSAFQKKGYLLPFYMIGYGVIRCFVEGLRTDSLYLMPGVRVSQVLSGCLILLGVLLIGIIRRRQDIQA